MSGKYEFTDEACNQLPVTEITLENRDLFGYDESCTTLVIPAGVNAVGDLDFADCNSL